MRRAVKIAIVLIIIAVCAVINSHLPTETEGDQLPNGSRWLQHKCKITVYEDGSGVRYCGNRESGTYPADTFSWDCHTMGNRVCGRPAGVTTVGGWTSA